MIVTLPRLGQIYDDFDDFDDSRTLQCTPILTCYMINFFWSIPHLFFHNAIALPELAFIFNNNIKNIYAKAPTIITDCCKFEDFKIHLHQFSTSNTAGIQ